LRIDTSGIICKRDDDILFSLFYIDFQKTLFKWEFTAVEGGSEGEGWVEVRRGLKEGDRVVIEGVFDIKNVLLKEHIGSGG